MGSTVVGVLYGAEYMRGVEWGPGQNLVQLCQLAYLVHPAINGPMQSSCVYKCESM